MIAECKAASKLAAHAILLCSLLWVSSSALHAQQSAPAAVGVDATTAEEPAAANAAAGPVANRGAVPPVDGADAPDLSTPADLSRPVSDAVTSPEARRSDPAAAESSSSDPEPQAGTPANSDRNRPADEHFVHDLAGDFLHDEYHIWTGPFHGSNYDTHGVKKYGIPFLLISAGLIASDTHTARWLPSDTTAVRFNTRVSQIGAPYSAAGLSAAYYLYGRLSHNDHARETGFLALEAVADTQVVAEVFKLITRRERPTTANVHLAGFWQGGSSFPSGHTIAAFGAATVFAREYREHIAVPIIAYSLASVVAFSRLGAHQHWYSDVFVGGAGGFMIGRYVYNSHHDTDLPGTPVPSRRSRLRPALEAGPQGLGLYWHF